MLSACVTVQPAATVAPVPPPVLGDRYAIDFPIPPTYERRQYVASRFAMVSWVGGTRNRRGAGFSPVRTALQNAMALARLAVVFA